MVPFVEATKKFQTRWIEYVENLYESTSRPEDIELKSEIRELETSMTNARTKNAAGEDRVCCKLIKYLPPQLQIK